MRKYLTMKDGIAFGYIGERTNYLDYHVGDIVIYTTGSFNQPKIGIVVYSPSNNHYSVFGWCSTNIEKLKDIYFSDMKKVISYNALQMICLKKFVWICRL